MKKIEIQLEDDGMQEILLSVNDALRQTISSLMDEKGEAGSVTLKISLGKYLFQDGYKRSRTGLNIDYRVDTQITNKSSYNDRIITDKMMLQESEYLGYVLVPAPDPQQTMEEYMEGL